MFTVPEKVISVPVSTGSAPRVTLLLYACIPVVVTAVVFIAVVPAPFEVRLVRFTPPPTIPEKVAVPEAVTVRSCPLFTVPEKVISVPVSTGSAPRVTLLLYACIPVVVTAVVFIAVVPAPFEVRLARFTPSSHYS